MYQCGGSFGSVATAIVRKAPGVRCIVQDLPKVINSAVAITSKNPNFPHDAISFQAHSFLEPQPVVADLYLFRMVFHNWCDQGARRIIRALLPVLKPGARIIAIEYVMPPIGSAPIYAEVATRRLDNVMYSLMKGKVRELEEFKDLFASVDTNLKFKSFRQGELKATHDPKCHSVLEWVYDPEPASTVTAEPIVSNTKAEEVASLPAVVVAAPLLQATENEPSTPVLSASSEASSPILGKVPETQVTTTGDDRKSAGVTVEEIVPKPGYPVQTS